MLACILQTFFHCDNVTRSALYFLENVLCYFAAAQLAILELSKTFCTTCDNILWQQISCSKEQIFLCPPQARWLPGSKIFSISQKKYERIILSFAFSRGIKNLRESNLIPTPFLIALAKFAWNPFILSKTKDLIDHFRCSLNEHYHPSLLNQFIGVYVQFNYDLKINIYKKNKKACSELGMRIKGFKYKKAGKVEYEESRHMKKNTKIEEQT